MGKVKIDKKKAMLILSALGLFLLCNAMWIVLTRFGLFSDEADNLLGGKIIADGGILYKDYLSQHTPLMYYICALFHKLGCITVPQYRTAFYMLLSAVWVFIYVRYSRHFGKITLILYPIIYIFAVSSIDMAFTILSDQIEANALLILFLEFLLFERTKTLKLSNCIIISAAIFFAVGTAFVSLYPLLFIFIGVVCLEIIWYFKNKSGRKGFAIKTVKKYSRLVGIVAVPLVVLIAALAMQHVLISAYNGAYLYNVTHYVNQSGVSGNIIETIISVFQNFIIYIKDVFTAFAGIGPLVKAHSLTNITENLQRVIFLAADIAFPIVLIKNKSYAAAVFSFLFVIIYGVRGFTFFHSTPYYAISSFMLAFLILKFIYSPLVMGGRPHFKTLLNFGNIVRIGVFSAVMVVLSVTYFYKYFIRIYDVNLGTAPPGKVYSDILKLTDKGDRIFDNTMDVYVYLYTDRMPASLGVSIVPWTSKDAELSVINDLKASRPKIIIYNPTGKIDGYVYKDSAPDFDAFVKSDYTHLGSSGEAATEWIRNDYLQTAKAKLGD